MCHNEDCIALFSWRHELQIARSIQQSLFPKVRPEIRGFEVAGWSQTARMTPVVISTTGRNCRMGDGS
jgi:hypothetical protein